jgi:hypothetical protein
MGSNSSSSSQQATPEDLSKFSETIENSKFSEIELLSPAFTFTHNYHLLGSPSRYSKISLNYESSEVTQLHSVSPPFLFTDSSGPSIYLGEVLKNSSTPDGRGFQFCPQPSYKFAGYFKAGQRNGRGRLVTKVKILEGDWLGHELVSEGKEIRKDSNYNGKFLNGLYEGLGKIVFSDKSSYSGEFSKGERNGYGEYLWNDGSKFAGYWKNSKFDGLGKYIDSHGNCFEGGWKENRMDGYGEFIWKDGRKYKGNYYNGKKHGYGEMYWNDGKYWRGNWKNGKMHGKAKFWNCGKEWTGVWYDGKFIEICKEGIFED